MLVRATIVWVLGLLTWVPYGTYYLFFEASRDQYALLITLILFWIFGYWSLVGPLFLAIKARSVLRAIESARSRDELEAAASSPDAREVAIDLIASENRLPRFLAARLYDRAIARLFRRAHASPPSTASRSSA